MLQPLTEGEFPPVSASRRSWLVRARRFAMSCVGQTPWKKEIHRGVLPPFGVCLKIPSCGQKAPPVRRRRSSGGVRVIHMPHRSPRFSRAQGTLPLCVLDQSCLPESAAVAHSACLCNTWCKNGVLADPFRDRITRFWGLIFACTFCDYFQFERFSSQP